MDNMHIHSVYAFMGAYQLFINDQAVQSHIRETDEKAEGNQIAHRSERRLNHWYWCL